VVNEALALLDEGASPLTLAALARRLDVRLPSLYSHVDGLPALLRQVRLVITKEIGRELQAAAGNRTGRKGLHAILLARRRYALSYPGRWRFMMSGDLDDDDPEFHAIAAQNNVPLRNVLRSFGLSEGELNYWQTLVWAWVFGYIHFEVVLHAPEFTESRFKSMIEHVASLIENRNTV
jgi:AcrR family transcriptional regulator